MTIVLIFHSTSLNIVVNLYLSSIEQVICLWETVAEKKDDCIYHLQSWIWWSTFLIWLNIMIMNLKTVSQNLQRWPPANKYVQLLRHHCRMFEKFCNPHFRSFKNLGSSILKNNTDLYYSNLYLDAVGMKHILNTVSSLARSHLSTSNLRLFIQIRHSYRYEIKDLCQFKKWIHSKWHDWNRFMLL